MEACRLGIILVLGTSCLIFSCQATACSSNNDCLHFEYCCKGNCTWTRLKCEHICQRDHDCGSQSRCVLGICVNCTRDFSCTRKSCLNDSHCPGGHSCDKELCEVNKKSDLTSEMAPFLIFITALSVSLLIVCYNDYFLERFGRRGWRERLERISCNCGLTYWYWMRRWRRQQQNNDPTCPAVEVQFESWSNRNNQSNSLNEKPANRRTIWPWRSFKRTLLSWRTNLNDIERSLSPEENNIETSTRNIPSSSRVILLNGFTNTNESITRLSSSNHQSSNSREQDLNSLETEQNATQHLLSSSLSVVDSNVLTTETRIPRSDDLESKVNNYVTTCSTEVTVV